MSSSITRTYRPHGSFVVRARGGSSLGLVTYEVTRGKNVISVERTSGLVFMLTPGSATITARKLGANGEVLAQTSIEVFIEGPALSSAMPCAEPGPNKNSMETASLPLPQEKQEIPATETKEVDEHKDKQIPMPRAAYTEPTKAFPIDPDASVRTSAAYTSPTTTALVLSRPSSPLTAGLAAGAAVVALTSLLIALRPKR